MADTHRIHLVRPSQVPSKPKSLEPADIASHALTIAKECTETLNALQDYSEMTIGQISAQLAQLEIIALRVMAQKARQSEQCHDHETAG